MLKYWVWLGLLDRNLNEKCDILEEYGNPEKAYRAMSGDDTDALTVIEFCGNAGIGIVTPDDDAYPEKLKRIYAPPAALYTLGKMPDFNGRKSLAFFGTACADEKLISLGSRISAESAEAGNIAVSPLKSVFDIKAAETSAVSGADTVCVLDRAFVKKKKGILSDAVLVSEICPLGSEPPKGNRDSFRIISALCDTAVLSAASSRSTARLFAAEALEQGRDVCIMNASSDNAARLIQQGAFSASDYSTIASRF